MKTKVWFVRHGESEANAGLRTADAATINITNRGKAQSKHLIEVLPNFPDLVVTSPFVRTKQTARAYLAAIDKVPEEEWAVQEFTYLDKCNDTTTVERRPRAQEYWKRSDPDYRDGDGTNATVESFASFFGRVDDLWQKVSKSNKDAVVVFCHGHVMRALVWNKLFGQPATKESMQGFAAFTNAVLVPNAAIMTVSLGRDTTFTGFVQDHIPVELRSI